MNIQDISHFINNILSNQNEILKIVLILLSLLFLLFTIILARQISLLTNQLNQVSFSPVLRFLGYAFILTTLTMLIVIILV